MAAFGGERAEPRAAAPGSGSGSADGPAEASWPLASGWRRRAGVLALVGGLGVLALLGSGPSAAAIVEPGPPAIRSDAPGPSLDAAGLVGSPDRDGTPAYAPSLAEPVAEPVAGPVAGPDAAPDAAPSAAASADPAVDTGPAGAASEPDLPGQGYRWRGPMAAAPDWRGAGRDAAYFVGYQLVGVAVIFTSPASMSGWSKEDKREFGYDQWQENVRNPVVWDGDQFIINWVLHPYWGAAYYVRGRERGLNEWQSFGFSVLLSTLWEYGAEAIAEPVSVQDLVFTPVLGALVGEYLFQPWRERIRAKPGELDGWDRTVLALTDPLGAINATIDRWFGIKSTSSLHPVVGRADVVSPRRLGIVDPTLSTRPSGHYWGLQLNVRW